MNLINNPELNRATEEYIQYNTIPIKFKAIQNNTINFLERHTYAVNVCSLV